MTNNSNQQALPLTKEVIDAWRWITSEAGRHTLDQLNDTDDLNRQVMRLKKLGLAQPQIHAAISQCQLRPLAAKKFPNAKVMFFEKRLLQQATSTALADYKAGRFSQATEVVDICCGLGGDLFSLAKTKSTMAIDRSPIAGVLAKANCQALGLSSNVQAIDAGDFVLPPSSWFHIDPDRRAETGHRTTKIDFFSPSIEYLESLVKGRSGALKLAPATRLDDRWAQAERQWLGDRRECKQQVIWVGQAARHPSRRTAAALDVAGNLLFEWQASQDTGEYPFAEVSYADQFTDNLYEPHPCLLAAKLVDSVADHFGLQRVQAEVDYLTGPVIDFAGLTRYQILETLPLEVRRVKAALKLLGTGKLEIKKRGIDHRWMEPFAKLRFSGDKQLVLVLTRQQNRHVAIVCCRTE